MNKTTKHKIQMTLIIAIIIFSIIGINSNASVLIQPRNIELLLDSATEGLQLNLEGIQEDLQEDIKLKNDPVITTKFDREPTNSANRLLFMLEGPLEELDVAISNLNKVILSQEFQEEAGILQGNLQEVVVDPLFQAAFMSLFGFILIVLGINFILKFITFIAKWRIYRKAGKPGWGLLLPVYADVLMLEIAGLSPALLLIYFIFFIPIVGPFIFSIAYLTINIIVAINVSKAFGQPGAFAIGLILLPTIFNSILGFGKSKYKKSNNEEVKTELEVEVKETEKEKIIEAKIEDVKEKSKAEVKAKKITTKKISEGKKPTNKKTTEGKKTTTKKTTEVKKTTTKPKETK